MQSKQVYPDAQAAPGETTISEAELRILARGDGTWLLFTTSKGHHARVKMEQIANSIGGAYGEVILEWCDDHHRRSTH